MSLAVQIQSKSENAVNSNTQANSTPNSSQHTFRLNEWALNEIHTVKKIAPGGSPVQILAKKSVEVIDDPAWQNLVSQLQTKGKKMKCTKLVVCAPSHIEIRERYLS